MIQAKTSLLSAKEVVDFSAVNDDYIFSVGIGAVQELSRQNKELARRDVHLESRIVKLEFLMGQIFEKENRLISRHEV